MAGLLDQSEAKRGVWALGFFRCRRAVALGGLVVSFWVLFDLIIRSRLRLARAGVEIVDHALQRQQALRDRFAVRGCWLGGTIDRRPASTRGVIDFAQDPLVASRTHFLHMERHAAQGQVVIRRSGMHGRFQTMC